MAADEPFAGRTRTPAWTRPPHESRFAPDAPRRRGAVRIAWFTAFSPRSGIAEFSRRVTPAIAERAEVDIWTPDAPPRLVSELPVFAFNATADVRTALAGYDVVVYNMGNTLQSHRPIHQVSMREPGIVIVHDRVLHPMFVAMWTGDGGRVDPVYVSRMAAYYGAAGARAASESISGARARVWESDEVVDYPLVEEALQQALGAVTHSESHARDLRARWSGPVRALHQPTYRQWVQAGKLADTTARKRADGRLQLTTVGHVNANKQSHRFIAMLARDPELAARTHYTIVGPLDDGNPFAANLAALIGSLPQVSAEILGWCEEQELDALMAATDIFVNLRLPVVESGSASLMRELAFGRPVLCFDGGLFAELPPQCVASTPTGDFAAVESELQRLVGDADYRRLIGENARRLAAERTEAAYAEALIEFIAEVREAPGLVPADRVVSELGPAGAGPAAGRLRRIAGDVQRILRR